MRGGIAGVAVVAFGLVVACASGGPSGTAISIVRVATGLDAPLHAAAPRSEPGRLYIVEQAGRIRVLENGRLRGQPFLDIRNLVQSGGEQGLLSVAFHPNYARNRLFYVDYTDVNGDTRVVEYRSNGTRALLATRRQLLFVAQPYPNHNGGQLVFGPDGKLYVGMGDGGSGGDPENRAQNLGSLLGKLLTIDVNRRGAKPQLAAIGLRNPWRFSFDRANGDLYVGDVGQNAREEIDYVRRQSPGLENYGWDVYEGSLRFERKEPSRGRLVFPIAQYGRSEGYSVTGGFVYRGTAVPALVGRYFYGDYGSGTIWSLKVVGGKATGLRKEPIRVPSLASFGEDARGELYAVSLDGQVYRIAR
ncbi:MAG: PQQ-dependent sugar dehydrogenase [Gaiellaceae bacterium]